MNYRISHWAKIDLEHIWFYTFENWSVKQADIYISTIFKAIKKNQITRYQVRIIAN
jgi:toxin ParE1/3/4